MRRAGLGIAALLSWFFLASPLSSPLASAAGADTISPAQATVYPATLCKPSEGRWHLQWIVRSRDSAPVTINANVDGTPVSFSPNPVGPGASAASSNKPYAADPPDVTLHYTLSTSRPNSTISGTSVATFTPCELPPTTTGPTVPATHVPVTVPPPPPPLPTFPPTTLAPTTVAPPTLAPTTTSTTIGRTTTTRPRSATTTTDPTTTRPPTPVGQAAVDDKGSGSGSSSAPLALGLALVAVAGIGGVLVWRRRAAASPA
jgi:hypothetical protein